MKNYNTSPNEEVKKKESFHIVKEMYGETEYTAVEMRAESHDFHLLKRSLLVVDPSRL